MVSSGVDSGIVGTVSMYSGVSTMASSHTRKILNAKQNEEINTESCIFNHGHTITDNNV